MDTVAQIKKLDSIKNIPIKDIAMQKFTKSENKIRSYKKTGRTLETRRSSVQRDIVQTQTKVEKLSEEIQETNNDQIKIEKMKEVSVLKESLVEKARDLRKYDEQISANNAEVDRLEMELRKAKKLASDATEELRALLLNLALPGAGTVYKNRALIAMIIIGAAFLLIVIIYSLISTVDTPGEALQTVIETQCLDATDPNCAIRFFETQLNNQFGNRTL